MRNMKVFSGKNGFVTHPVMLFFFGIILGLVAAYLWVNYTTVPNPFCK